MAISEQKMKIVIENYFKAECSVNTSIREAFEKGFRIGVKKGQLVGSESAQWVQMLINPNLYKCSNCQVAWNKRLVFDNERYSENIFMKYCPCCGKKMKTEVGYE